MGYEDAGVTVEGGHFDLDAIILNEVLAPAKVLILFLVEVELSREAQSTSAAFILCFRYLFSLESVLAAKFGLALLLFVLADLQHGLTFAE